MTDRINFADCYVLTNQRSFTFLLSFLDHFVPQREAYASEFEVPQHADPPDQVFTASDDLMRYMEQHPNEMHAIYWENKELSTIRAAMCLYTSDGQVIVGLTSETYFPDTSLERDYLQQLEAFCNSSISLIEYDTPAAKDTTEFLQRVEQQRFQLIRKAYEAFNNRDIDAALQLMSPDVQWPNGWEGGYVYGHDGVRAYWTRQWKEIDPHVSPLSITQEADKRISVLVQQLVKDKTGKLLFEGQVSHIYTIDKGLITHMEIEK